MLLELIRHRFIISMDLFFLSFFKSSYVFCVDSKGWLELDKIGYFGLIEIRG